MQIKKTAGNFFVFHFTEPFGNAERLCMEELKDKIPPSHRKWFPAKRVWKIHMDVWEEFWKILGGYVRNKTFNNLEVL